MDLPVILGAVAATLFAGSNLPMLYRAQPRSPCTVRPPGRMRGTHRVVTAGQLCVRHAAARDRDRLGASVGPCQRVPRVTRYLSYTDRPKARFPSRPFGRAYWSPRADVPAYGVQSS